jgi:hypothetical protein
MNELCESALEGAALCSLMFVVLRVAYIANTAAVDETSSTHSWSLCHIALMSMQLYWRCECVRCVELPLTHSPSLLQ